MGTWTREAAYAARELPASISAFTCTPIPPSYDGEPSLTLDLAVKCTACGWGEFAISAFPLIAPDPSPYFAIEPGQTIQRPPHRLACAKCSATGKIFDARTDGYDGHLNGGCSYESGTTGESFLTGPYSVVVSLAYNNDLDEMIEDAASIKVLPSDLFDWFTLTGTLPDGVQIILDYECA